MSYEQAVKHNHNHSKDRFHQQCSGYSATLAGALNGALTDAERNQRILDNYDRISKASMTRILGQADTFVYPIYIRQHGDGFWDFDDRANAFTTQINNKGELQQFALDYA